MSLPILGPRTLGLRSIEVEPSLATGIEPLFPTDCAGIPLVCVVSPCRPAWLARAVAADLAAYRKQKEDDARALDEALHPENYESEEPVAEASDEERGHRVQSFCCCG